MNVKPDVVAALADPVWQRPVWTTGGVYNCVRNRGNRTTTMPSVLSALRKAEKAGLVECLGAIGNDGKWHGHNVVEDRHLTWKLKV